ncbi:MAG: 30S ribosomal protein S6 [Gammaproteobacteria bacterium]|nr:30S ribosomal protein S6 [Gammaproteobacteria bacterium]|tara:strand:+ start:3303 stop:3722 length:420 start_codon:yes stop_codon:yes gene_type:complete
MRHYEIVFLVHPDQSDQTQSVLNKFSTIVNERGGTVHRTEDIGRRKLSYPIQDQFKASYALMNVECNKEAIEEIKSSLKFNDSIIRDLILVKNKAQKNLSALSTQTEEEEDIDNIQNKEGVPEDSEKVSKKKVSESKEA